MKNLITFLMLLVLAPFASANGYLNGDDGDLYTFDASAQTVTFTNVDLNLVLSIVNETDQVEIFKAGDPDIGGSQSQKLISLNYNTTNMSDADVLFVRYDAFDGMCKRPVLRLGRQTNADAALTDVWDSTTNIIWDAPNASRIHALVSTSVEDSDVGGAVAQGDGARTVLVCGLTTWVLPRSCETVIMDGTTAVNTGSAYVIIDALGVTDYASLGPNVGIITATAASDASITAQINVGKGRAQMAIFGVPSIRSLHIDTVHTSALGASPASTQINYDILVNSEADSFFDGYTTQHTEGLMTVGTSVENHEFHAHHVVNGPAIVKLQVLSDKADADVSGGFSGCLYPI